MRPTPHQRTRSHFHSWTLKQIYPTLIGGLIRYLHLLNNKPVETPHKNGQTGPPCHFWDNSEDEHPSQYSDKTRQQTAGEKPDPQNLLFFGLPKSVVNHYV